MSSRLLIWSLCAGAVVLACAPRLRAVGEANAVAAPAADAPPRRIALPEGESPLASSLNVSVDGGVLFALHVTNRGGEPLEFLFPSGATHDFVVLDSAGREVWRWSADRLFTQVTQSKSLGPQETATYRERWDADGRTGRFTAVARLRSSNFPVEQRIAFSLP